MESFKCIWITSLLKLTNMFNIKPDFTMYKNTMYQNYLSSVILQWNDLKILPYTS